MGMVRKHCPECKGTGLHVEPDPFGGPVPLKQTCQCVDELEAVSIPVGHDFVAEMEKAIAEHRATAAATTTERLKAFELGAAFAYEVIATTFREELAKALKAAGAMVLQQQMEAEMDLLALMEQNEEAA